MAPALAPNRYNVTPEAIRDDLTTELPQWILSSYAPGKSPPDQLFGGYPREQSFEELQLRYREGVASGNEQAVRAEIDHLFQNARSQIETALADTTAAANFVLSAESRHPNRHDLCKQSVAVVGGATFLSTTGAAVAPTTTTTSTMSAFGQRPNPFGAPAFGQPSQPAFGQPSQPAFGQASQPASAFGRSQPAFGQSSQPAFGQPSQPAFGQVSQSAFSQSAQPAFGQSSQPTFGQPSQPAFGQSAFGQASQPQSSMSAFGQASQTQPQSTFGQSSALGSRPSPFGQPSFGQPAQAQGDAQGTNISAFGQPSALGAKPNPFSSFASAGNDGSNKTAFGAASNASPSPFASANAAVTPTPFGQSANNPSPFGASSTGNTSGGAFGQPSSATQNANAPANPFHQAAAASSNPFASMNNNNNNNNNNSPNPFANAQQSNSSPFGQPQTSAFGAPTTASTASPFAQSTAAAATTAPRKDAATNGPYPPTSSRTHPPVSAYSTSDANGLVRWKGKPVIYRDNHPGVQEGGGGGGFAAAGQQVWVRIWHPKGAPDYTKDTELPDDAYSPQQAAQWQPFLQTGRFDGMMPELPPKREFCTWDF